MKKITQTQIRKKKQKDQFLIRKQSPKETKEKEQKTLLLPYEYDGMNKPHCNKDI